jgi:PAS domain S-box-containing protein
MPPIGFITGLRNWFFASARRNQQIARATSGVVVLVGCLVLIGWGWDIPLLKSIFPSLASMKANTALCFVLAGVSLGLQTRKRQSAHTVRIAQGCAIAVSVVGFLTLCQYLFNWNLGIDELLFQDHPISPATSHPGRMGDNTALNFVLTGLALWLNRQRIRHRDSIAQALTLCAAAIALLAVAGYAYNVEVFHRFIFYSTSMAIHTALTFLVLSVGILSIQADRGFMKTLTLDLTGSIAARQLIPIAIAVPLILGWFILQGLRANLYDAAFSFALLIVALMFTLILIIWENAHRLNQVDYDRKRSSDRLRSNEERLQLALAGANQGIWDWNLKTRVLTWDDRCKEIFGLPSGFPVTYEWHFNALHPDDRQRVFNAAAIAMRDRTDFDEEYRTFHPDGTMRWVLARGRGYYNAAGEPHRMSGTVMDVSDRKQAEAALVETNNILQAVIQSTNDVIFVKDLQGRYVLTNQAVARWLNTTVESMLGQDDVALFPADVVQRIQAVDRSVMQSGEPITYEEQLLKQGDQRSLLTTKYPWRDEQGEIIGIIGISIDVTDLRQAEVALRESEERYRHIFKSVGVSIWEEDFAAVKGAIDQLKASGIQDFHRYFAEHPEFVQWAIGAIRILDVNDVTLRMTGAQDKAQLLTSLYEISLPETIQAITDELLTIAAGETFFQSETAVRTLQGERLYVLFTITFPPPTEPYDRVLVTWTDISDRKQAQLNDQFLNKLDRRLRQLSDAPAMAWEVVSSLGEYLNVDRCLWHEIDWENRFTTVERNWRREDVPDVAGIYALEEYFTPQQLSRFAAGQTLIIYDVTTHPDTAPYAQNYLPLGAGAFVSVPCIQSGRWVAVLAVNTKMARNWRDDEVALLQETVARLWSLIEHTRATQALRESEDRYRTLFESVDQGFCICEMLLDENGEPQDYRFLEINPAFEQMTGLQQAVGKTARELVPELESFWFETYGNVALTGVPARFENHSKAMQRWFDVQAFRIGNPQRYRFGILFTNITERKLAEQEREQLLIQEQAARQEAERLNRLKDEFLAALSHELRTPLNPILGWTKILQAQKLAPDQVAQALETIERNVRQQITLVNDLLDVSRVIQGKLHLNFHPVDLALMLTNVIETVHFTAQAKGISIALQGLPSLLTMGDSDRLQQIFWNLLSNAIKFTPVGGRVEVCLSLVIGHWSLVEDQGQMTNNQAQMTNDQRQMTNDQRSMTNYAQITITDTGIGIAPEFLPHVFDRFRQADGSTTRKYGGLGLGLAIVRHLVELHGGTVQAASPGVGQGATFTVKLPLTSQPNASNP